MKTLVSINCAGPEKLPLLWATLTSILHCGLPASSRVRINYNSSDVVEFHRPNDGYGFDTLRRLFKASGLELDMLCLPDLSVAQMYASALEQAIEHGFEAVLKIDDDCIVKYLSDVFLIAKRGHPYVSLNFWDIHNTRGYDDWRESVSDDQLTAMIEQYGERTVWCHRWVPSLDLEVFHYDYDTSVNASLFLIRTDNIPTELIGDLKAIGKGERGMDKVVGDAYKPYSRVHSLRSCAWHMGVYRPQLDGKYWTSFQQGSEITHARPTLNKDNGRGYKMFFGREVEHTPFFGQRTLFVQGLVDHEHVLAYLKVSSMGDQPGVQHVYLGAGGLSQLDCSLVPKLLGLNVNVTVEAVVFPDEVKQVLVSPSVVLVLPITNEGRYQDQAIKAAIAWYEASSDWQHQVFFKIDTAEPKVLVFSPWQAYGLTLPSDYTKDFDVPCKSFLDWMIDRESWID